MIQKATLEEIKQELNNYSIPIIKRIAKLCVYTEADADKRNKWIEKIYEFVHIIPVDSATNQLPKREFILSVIFSITDEELEKVVYNYIKDCESRGYPKVDMTEDIYNNICYCMAIYSSELSSKLSESGFVTFEWVKDKLLEILNSVK